MANFKSGDKVKHTSGGPTMTVDHYIGATRQVLCKWWSEKEQKFVFDEFNENSLVSVE